MGAAIGMDGGTHAYPGDYSPEEQNQEFGILPDPL